MLKNKNRDALPSVWAGAAGLLLAGWLLTGCQPPGPAALLEGKKLLDQGKPAAAVAPLTDATAILKTNALAWSYLGLARQQCGQLNEAIAAYGLALRYNRDFNEIHFNLGCALLDQGKAEAARDELRAYTLRQTRDPMGWVKLGQAQLRLRDLPSAESSFRESLRQGTNALALDGLGQIYVQRNRSRDAVPYFTAALKHDPTYRTALRNLAWAQYQGLRNYPAALQAFREYAALKPPPTDLELTRNVVRDLEQRLAPPPVAPAPTAAVPLTSPVKPVFTNVAATPAPRPAATYPPVAAPTTPPATVAALVPAPVVPRPAPVPANVAAAPRPELPVVQLPDAPDPAPTQDVFVPPATAAPPELPPATTVTPAPAPVEAPKKKGFFARLNPLNLLRKDSDTASDGKPAVTTTPLPPAPTFVPVAPTVAEAPPVPAPTPAPTPRPAPTPAPAPAPAPAAAVAVPIPVPPTISRYAYRNLPPLVSGRRAEATPLFNAAIQAQQAGRPVEASENYLRAVQADPAFFEAWYNLSLVARDLRQTGNCLTACEVALTLKPDSADARFNFALVLRDAGYLLDAAVELEKLLAQNPNDVRSHLAIANLCAQKLNQPQRARVHYLKVLELDPRNHQAANIRDWLVTHPG